MNDDELKKITHNTIGAMLSKMPTLADRSNALEFLLQTSYLLVRMTKGDGFAHGWLAGALHELKACKPDDSTAPAHCVQHCSAFPQTPTSKH
jgi:hypothetical protein